MSKYMQYIPKRTNYCAKKSEKGDKKTSEAAKRNTNDTPRAEKQGEKGDSRQQTSLPLDKEGCGSAEPE